jgi:hypothetical protein
MNMRLSLAFYASFLGGPCVLGDVIKRKLQGSLCDCPEGKCCGAGACPGFTPEFISNNIGPGSCCGAWACVGLPSEYKNLIFG